MRDNRLKLSKYIDTLNAEKKPVEHVNSMDSPELEKLYGTVRQVRSLKEPSLPDSDFPKRMAHAVVGRPSQKEKRAGRAWFAKVAALAAVVLIAVIFYSIMPFSRTNIVLAMEKAFQEVKAYHGILEVVESDSGGNETSQARLEVWSDKSGHYYVKSLEGYQKGLVTANNGQLKWQIRPLEKQAYLFPSFPDSYRFMFELGREVENVRNSLEYRVVGEDTISGRKASIVEVKPQGGIPYRIWIDKETRLPLQRQSGMQNSIQYRVTYTKLDIIESIPAEFTAYKLPDGFKENGTYQEQLVNNLQEASEITGFNPDFMEKIPEGYGMDSIAVLNGTKTVKTSYIEKDTNKRIIFMQAKVNGAFEPASTSILGKIDNSIAEIQSPIDTANGILAGAGPYAGVTDTSSIRWQKGGYEFAVIGNVSLEEMASFITDLTGSNVNIQKEPMESRFIPETDVPTNLEVEENDQKNADAGHSPWKLDPVFVAQVFVSLKISPEGIQGDYPIKTEELKIVENNGKEAIVEVSGDKTPVRKVYLKRLIRQDSTGIWTVVGFDPVK
jgi:Negative regulator of sigma E activity